MKSLVVAAVALAMPCTAIAAECNSVGATAGGKRIVIARTVSISNRSVVLTGIFDGKPTPRRVLPCVQLAEGIMCEKRFAYGLVTIMTNRNLMTETVTARSGEEATFSYACNQAFRIKR